MNSTSFADFGFDGTYRTHSFIDSVVVINTCILSSDLADGSALLLTLLFIVLIFVVIPIVRVLLSRHLSQLKMKCAKSVCHPRSLVSVTLLSVSLILFSLISIISSETIAKSADYDSDNDLETIDSNSETHVQSPIQHK